MMNRQDSTLSAYLKRVMALKEELRRTPSDEELKSVAREVGLSDDDLAAIDRAATDHAVRGQSYLEHGRYDDAITELEEAVAVAPRRVEWLQSLAEAHAGRFHDARAPADAERAEALARLCLEIDPRHTASYEVLNQLDRPVPPAAVGGAPAPAKRMGALLTMFAVAMLLTVVIASVVLWNTTERPSAPTATEGMEPAAREAPGTGSVEQGASERDVPVTLDAGTTGVVLGLDARLSRLVNYSSGGSFYTLNALLHNRGVTEIDKLGARLELLDEAGSVVDAGAFEAVGKSAPVLRPGDANALHRLVETGATVRAARLVLETVEQNPAAATYAAGEPLDVEWRVERSADFAIALRQRGVRFSENAFGDGGGGYFDAVIEVENTGTRTIRALKLEAEIAGEGWTVSETGHVVTSSGPAMQAGEVRLKRFIEKVEGSPSGYRLFVVAIE